MSSSLLKQHVLVTGGCGYIGSHTILQLLGSNVRYVDEISIHFPLHYHKTINNSNNISKKKKKLN